MRNALNRHECGILYPPNDCPQEYPKNKMLVNKRWYTVIERGSLVEPNIKSLALMLQKLTDRQANGQTDKHDKINMPPIIQYRGIKIFERMHVLA